MIDNICKNSFKEVYDILKYTEEDLLNKIPNKFMMFIKNNMNVNYKTNIDLSIDIDKQNLLPETEGISSLLYINYWATDEEKKEFTQKNQQDYLNIDRNIYEILNHNHP